MEKHVFPLVDRPTPFLDLVRSRSNPVFKERKLYGVLAETPEEIRSFRRGVVSGVISAVFLAAYLGTILERIPTTTALSTPRK